MSAIDLTVIDSVLDVGLTSLAIALYNLLASDPERALISGIAYEGRWPFARLP